MNIFRFQDGHLWWRDHRSGVREFKRVRSWFEAEPWTGATPTSAELVEQIDTALEAMKEHA